MLNSVSISFLVTLFHGSTSNYLSDLKDTAKIRSKFSKSNKLVDNGPGFYLSPSSKQALKQAERKTIKYNTWLNKQKQRNTQIVQSRIATIKPVTELIVEYDFDVEKFIYLKENYLILSEPNEDWAHFILNNRLGNRNFIDYKYAQNRNQEFGLVYSVLADGFTAAEVNDYEESKQTQSDFEKFHNAISLQKSAGNLGMQLSLHRDEIIQECLVFKGHKLGNNI